MQFKNTIVALASIVGLAAAQSLTEVLTTNSASLSTLSSKSHTFSEHHLQFKLTFPPALLEGQPEIVEALSQAQNITILAPSNEAFAKFLALPGNEGVATQTDLVAALLQVGRGNDPGTAFQILTPH